MGVGASSRGSDRSTRSSYRGGTGPAGCGHDADRVECGAPVGGTSTREVVMKLVTTEEAPAAVGPYSQAVVTGGLVFVSGQIPLDPRTGSPVGGTFGEQVRRALDNLAAVLRAAGSSCDRVVKVVVYMTDMELFGELNAVYEAFFGDHRPARAVVEVAALPGGMAVEIDAVAEVAG